MDAVLSNASRVMARYFRSDKIKLLPKVHDKNTYQEPQCLTSGYCIILVCKLPWTGKDADGGKVVLDYFPFAWLLIYRLSIHHIPKNAALLSLLQGRKIKIEKRCEHQ